MEFKKNTIFLIPFFYLVAGIFVILNHPAALSSDMFFYYSIARKYSLGEFYHALNGYWAPLLPWLLALFFKVGIFWKALAWINLIGGAVLIVYTIKISALLKFSGPTTWAITILNSWLALAHQLDTTTPDFLSVVCLLVFVFHYYENDLNNSSLGWVKTSIVALLLIFSKVFYFYFIVTFLLAEGLYGLLQKKKQFLFDSKSRVLIKQLFMIVGVYFIWVTALSVKYEKFVFSTTGTYNSTIGTPNGNGVQYFTYSGLVKPKSAYSFGNEDVTYESIQSRKPFASMAAFEYQLDIFKYNFQILNYLMSYFSYFRWFVLLIPLGLLFYGYFPERTVAIKIFLMGCLILLGYFLIFYEERYVTTALFCFIVTSFYFFGKIDFFRNIIIHLILLCIPLVAFGKNGMDSVNVWQSRLPAYEEAQKVSDRLLKSRLFEGKRIANASDAYGCTYMSMLTLQSSCIYYGELGMYHTNEENFEELKKHNIEYLFYFGCARIDEGGACIDSSLPFYLQSKKIVYSDSVARLTVYQLF